MTEHHDQVWEPIADAAGDFDVGSNRAERADDVNLIGVGAGGSAHTVTMTHDWLDGIHADLDTLIKRQRGLHMRKPLAPLVVVVERASDKPCPWAGKEDPKERARRLWANSTQWQKSGARCWRVDEAAPDGCPEQSRRHWMKVRG